MNKTQTELSVKFILGRVCGYIRPVTQWNIGKQEEFKDRTEFKLEDEVQ